MHRMAGREPSSSYRPTVAGSPYKPAKQEPDMKFRLGRLPSNIFIILYVLATFLLRFFLEPQLQGHVLISIGIGAFALLFLWALIKVKFLNPSILGLGRKREGEQ